jgi:hypothetical protein
MYACSPRWPSDWISESDLQDYLKILAAYIEPAPSGPDSVSVSHGLHFTGGEPFLNYSLLCEAVALGEHYNIPSTFVETNCFWATDKQVTREKLVELKALGLKGIMISVNPFYLEYVPFERTRRCVEISIEVFGQNTMIYQIDFYRHFERLGISGCLSLQDYLRMDGSSLTFRYTEFFMMGRAAQQTSLLPERFKMTYPADKFFNMPCDSPFLRDWHNHVDNYGNYIPGFCGGISLGTVTELPRLVNEGLNLDDHPVLEFIIHNDFAGLCQYANQRGYPAENRKYRSKCHFCLELRKHLVQHNNFSELQPSPFYKFA